MTRNEIHADKNLRVVEKHIFLWLNDNFSTKEFYITLADIGKGVSIHACNVRIHIKSLFEKGYIKKINHVENKNKRNSYIICK